MRFSHNLEGISFKTNQFLMFQLWAGSATLQLQILLCQCPVVDHSPRTGKQAFSFIKFFCVFVRVCPLGTIATLVGKNKGLELKMRAPKTAPQGSSYVTGLFDRPRHDCPLCSPAQCWSLSHICMLKAERIQQLQYEDRKQEVFY